MLDLLTTSLWPINIGFTVLLVLVVIYWVMVIIGAMSVDLFQVDAAHVDVGADVDVDAGADLDAGAHADAWGHDGSAEWGSDGGADAGHDAAHDVAHDGGADHDHGHVLPADHGVDKDLAAPAHAGGLWKGLLSFYHVGELPIMMIISLMVLFLWAVSVTANYYFNPGRSFLLSLPILGANLVVSSLAVKALVWPMRGMFKAFSTDYNAPRAIIGRICTLTTRVGGQRLGQAEVPAAGAPVLLNVKTEDGRELQKGDQAVVIEMDKTTGVYLIAPVELEK